MAIINIGDLLNRAINYEDRLEKYYAEIRDRSKDNGTKLLSYYFSRHRRHLKQALNELKPDQIQRIRKVKLKYDIEFNPEKVFKIIDISPEEVKGNDLLEAGVKYNTALIELYKKILQQPLIREVSIFFESLIRVEERDIVMMKKMIAMNYF